MSVSGKQVSPKQNNLNGQLDLSEIKGSGLGIGSEEQGMDLLARAAKRKNLMAFNNHNHYKVD